MGGQEVVALLQRGELLKRQRVDPAQFGQVALSPLGTSLLGGPVERHRRRCGHLFSALPSLLVFGHLQVRGRQGHLRSVFGDQIVAGHAELFEHHLLELFDAQRGLGFGHLVAVQRVGQFTDARVERGDLLADCRQRSRPLPALLGQPIAFP